MRRRGLLLGIAALLTVTLLVLVFVPYPGEGPVLASVSRTHGTHSQDLVALAGWALGMAAIAVSWRRSRRRD